MKATVSGFYASSIPKASSSTGDCSSSSGGASTARSSSKSKSYSTHTRVQELIKLLFEYDCSHEGGEEGEGERKGEGEGEKQGEDVESTAQTEDAQETTVVRKSKGVVEYNKRKRAQVRDKHQLLKRKKKSLVNSSPERDILMKTQHKAVKSDIMREHRVCYIDSQQNKITRKSMLKKEKSNLDVDPLRVKKIGMRDIVSGKQFHQSSTHSRFSQSTTHVPSHQSPTQVPSHQSPTPPSSQVPPSQFYSLQLEKLCSLTDKGTNELHRHTCTHPYTPAHLHTFTHAEMKTYT